MLCEACMLACVRCKARMHGAHADARRECRDEARHEAHPLIGPILRVLTLACAARCCFGLKKPLYSGTLLNCSVASYTAMSSLTISDSVYSDLLSIRSTYSTCFTHEIQTGCVLSGMRCSNRVTLRTRRHARRHARHACEACMRGMHARCEAHAR